MSITFDNALLGTAVVAGSLGIGVFGKFKNKAEVLAVMTIAATSLGNIAYRYGQLAYASTASGALIGTLIAADIEKSSHKMAIIATTAFAGLVFSSMDPKQLLFIALAVPVYLALKRAFNK